MKELQNVLPIVTDSLFELHAPVFFTFFVNAKIASNFTFLFQAGWSLRTLTKANNPRDFDIVANLLSPRGPVINLCYKLLADSTIKYEFPLRYIPVK